MDNEFNELVANMIVLKRRHVEAEAAYEKSRQELTQYMEHHSLKTEVAQVGDSVYQATYVRPEVINIDEKVLIKAVGRRVYNKATERKLNKKLLYSLVQQGVIDGEVVAKASYLSYNKAYPLISEVADAVNED